MNTEPSQFTSDWAQPMNADVSGNPVTFVRYTSNLTPAITPIVTQNKSLNPRGPPTEVSFSPTESLLQEVMRRLEEEGARKAATLIRDRSAGPADILNALKDGDSEFQAKMGRPMTYSEMRQMYG